MTRETPAATGALPAKMLAVHEHLEAAGLDHGDAPVQVVEAGEGIGLQRACEAGQVLARMLAGPPGGEAEHGDRGLTAAARPGVVGVDPEAAIVSAGAAGIEDTHRRIVGMDLGPLDQQLEQAIGARSRAAASTQPYSVVVASSTPSRA